MALNKLTKWIGTQAMTAFFDQLNDNVDATNAAIDLAETNSADISFVDSLFTVHSVSGDLVAWAQSRPNAGYPVHFQTSTATTNLPAGSQYQYGRGFVLYRSSTQPFIVLIGHSGGIAAWGYTSSNWSVK